MDFFKCFSIRACYFQKLDNVKSEFLSLKSGNYIKLWISKENVGSVGNVNI